MHRSVLRHVTAAWNRNTPTLASDENPTKTLKDVTDDLRSEWEKRFDDFASRGGKKFSEEAGAHADAAFKAKLRNAGFTVRFRTTRTLNEVLRASITENVALIKTLPEQYFGQIETLVMQAVQTGRDMAVLAKGLEHQFGVMKRRAAIIARDQVNKTTAVVVRVRQAELGITEAIWLHSAGGRKPRPSHVKMDGGRYEVAKGMWDTEVQRFVFPGELISCRCVSRAVIPGIED